VTKIYTYCLFDHAGTFYGVYSSLHAIHRDAVKLCNKGASPVLMEYEGAPHAPSLTKLRNMLKGVCDVQVKYTAGAWSATIIKTKLRE